MAYLRRLATTSDTARIAVRDNLHLSAVSANDVYQVYGDSALCDRAARAERYANFGADTGVLNPVWIIRYGTSRYVVHNGTRAGEWWAWSVYDTTFARLSGFVE